MNGGIWVAYIEGFTMSTAITTIQVAASTDDDRTNDGTWPATSNHSVTGTNSVIGQYPATYWTMVAVRFLSVPVAQGATIESASLSFMAHANYADDSVIFQVAGEDVDSAATFGDTHTAYNAYQASTQSVVDWVPGAWIAGSWYTTGNLDAIVQEIVSRDNWASGNNMAFTVYAKNDQQTGYRRVRMWDYTGNASGAKLDITYASAAGQPAIRRLGGVADCSPIQHRNPSIAWG